MVCIFYFLPLCHIPINNNRTMKTTRHLFLLMLLLFLTACSAPAYEGMACYESALSRADSLARSGVADSVQTVRLLSDLHREYVRVKEETGGKRVRLMPANEYKRFGWLAFTGLMVGLNIWLSLSNIRFSDERKHRRYLVSLSENEQRLRNNEQERAGLQECLEEMSLTGEEREEVQQLLVSLMESGNRLYCENDSLRLRLREYEKQPMPREVELLELRDERIRLLDGQVDALSAMLVEQDETVRHLQRHPHFLTGDDWFNLSQLADRVYDGFISRLAGRFPRLTSVDRQIALLILLRFTNVQIARLIAVSPASVSQQRFRLKKRMMQTEEELFKEGETVEEILARI